jgi:hypothetical protein
MDMPVHADGGHFEKMIVRLSEYIDNSLRISEIPKSNLVISDDKLDMNII